MLTPIIIGLVTAGGLMVAGKATSLNEAVDRLSYSISFNKIKMKSITTISIVIDVKLINPTAEAFEIKNSWIKVFNKKTEISITDLKQKTYTLAPFGFVNLENIEFPISLMSLSSVAIELVKKINKESPLEQNTEALKDNIDKILKDISLQIITNVNNIPFVIEEALGYAPLSAIERPITDANGKFDKYFPEPRGKKELVIKNGSVDDTVKKMIEIVNQDAHLIKDASLNLFKTETILGTSKKLFDWIYKYIKYNLEEGEQLKNPLVTYHLGQRLAVKNFKEAGSYDKYYSADCDDISIFVASVLKNLNIPYAFRITSYRDILGNDNGYSHVYVIIPLKNGQEIIIDPVFYYFNQQKSYSKKKDFMELSGTDVYYLSGFGDLADSLAEINIDDDAAIFTYLQKSRDYIKNNPDKVKFAKSSDEIIKMYDYAIKYWHTDKRNEALDVLAKTEEQLIQAGILSKNGIDLNGLGELSFFNNLLSKLNSWKGARNMKRESGNERLLTQINSNIHSLNYAGLDGSNSIVLGSDPTTQKTLKSIIAQYRVPIAIGGGLAAFGISYWLYKRNQNKNKKA